MNPVGRDLVEQGVPRGTFERLVTYVDLLTLEATEQNLISPRSLPLIWQRHILDSLQLLPLADQAGTWIDLGSGAGLPGIVVALASDRPVVLIEPRRRRADFLAKVVQTLRIDDRVTVIPQRSEVMVSAPAAIVSARAVASLDAIFAMAAHLANRTTQWILPKGRSAADEVANARKTWQGDYRLVPSLTEPGSAIVVARDIRRRGQP